MSCMSEFITPTNLFMFLKHSWILFSDFSISMRYISAKAVPDNLKNLWEFKQRIIAFPSTKSLLSNSLSISMEYFL